MSAVRRDFRSNVISVLSRTLSAKSWREKFAGVGTDRSATSTLGVVEFLRTWNWNSASATYAGALNQSLGFSRQSPPENPAASRSNCPHCPHAVSSTAHLFRYAGLSIH